MDSLYSYLIIVHKCGHPCDKVEVINMKRSLNLTKNYNNGQFSEQFKTKWYNYCSGITNICVCSHYLLLLATVILLAVLLVGIIVVVPVSLWVMYLVVTH